MLQTTGSVVAVSGKGCSSVTFYPRQGERVTFSSQVCSRPGYDVGDSVELFYDPSEPQNAHIDSFVQNWFVSLILGGFGLLFMLGGLVFLVPAALAGIVQSSQVHTSLATYGPFGTELDVIAAVVLGGTSIMGGNGSVARTVLGVLFLGVLNSGMNILNVSVDVQLIAKGIIIALALGLAQIR